MLSLHLAHAGLLLPLLLALGVAQGHGVDNGADKEAYHDDHNLLKEPRQPALLLPGAMERTERERSWISEPMATPPLPHTLLLLDAVG